MTKSSSFLKHAAVYGAGNLLVSAAGFILLPLYVRCLSEGEYGVLDYLNRLGEVVLLCLLIKGLRQALLAFHNQAKTEAERRAVVGSALMILTLFLGGAGCVRRLASDSRAAARAADRRQAAAVDVLVRAAVRAGRPGGVLPQQRRPRHPQGVRQRRRVGRLRAGLQARAGGAAADAPA